MTAVLLLSWHICGTLLDHLDANYRRVRRPDNLSSQQALSTVVHASGCACQRLCVLLLYVLLYGDDARRYL